MNRPSRKLAHLQEKIARKESISLKKPGKRTKTWRKFAAAATVIIEGLANPTAGAEPEAKA
jgi:hypothetical protein